MISLHEDFRRELREHEVLFSCEGTAEKVIIEKLFNAGKLVMPKENVVRDIEDNPYTGDRRAKDLQRDFLGLNYPHGLLLVRIVDVHPGILKFSSLYRDQVRVRDVVTRTEIEVLILVKEGQYQNWYRHGKNAGLMPSQWCIQKLGLKAVKTRDFLESYWADADELAVVIHEYTEALGGHKNDQLNLADLLSE